MSMDVTFWEFEPYYTSGGTLDQFLEFSPITEGDSRERENKESDSQREEVIVGTIPCPNQTEYARDVIVPKELKVYQRRRFGKQGEKQRDKQSAPEPPTAEPTAELSEQSALP